MTTTNPLAAFTAGAFDVRNDQPIPLSDTRFDVEIQGGLAVVRTHRTFRNVEAEAIEATITFPVPVLAQVFALDAVIDGRRLVGVAKEKTAAREAYEDAIDRGKPAVLHEEALKGVHKLSVANIAPGAEVVISAAWVTSLALVDGAGRLRIPLTVGDIYGRSGLDEVDELVTGGPNAMARLTVRSEAGEVDLVGGALHNGAAFVGLNAPIDLKVRDWRPAPLRGVSHDGRAMELTVEAAGHQEQSLDVAILVDHSGSMAGTMDPGGGSKHDAVVEALKGFQAAPRDRFDLWQFQSETSHVGVSTPGADRGPSLADLAARLAAPKGGTEIGKALRTVMARSKAADILLITDGQSFDVQPLQLARCGRRVSVLLVGEGSLEAKVGHLAALTGGDIYVAADDQLPRFLVAALDGLRQPGGQAPASESAPESLDLVRNGLRMEARWSASASDERPAGFGRAVAAFCTGLALRNLPDAAASRLAAAEGLITHMTSLVLVDEAAEAQAGLPATRKVALPPPRPSSQIEYRMRAPTEIMPLSAAAPLADEGRAAAERNPVGRPIDFARGSDGADRSSVMKGFYGRAPGPAGRQGRASPVVHEGLPRLDLMTAMSQAIDWTREPARLRAGDLRELCPSDVACILDWANAEAVSALAGSLGIDPKKLVLAFIASLKLDDRAALRLVRSLVTSEQIGAFWTLLGTAG